MWRYLQITQPNPYVSWGRVGSTASVRDHAEPLQGRVVVKCSQVLSSHVKIGNNVLRDTFRLLELYMLELAMLVPYMQPTFPGRLFVGPVLHFISLTFASQMAAYMSCAISPLQLKASPLCQKIPKSVGALDAGRAPFQQRRCMPHPSDISRYFYFH